jgi:hypothetical protein
MSDRIRRRRAPLRAAQPEPEPEPEPEPVEEPAAPLHDPPDWTDHAEVTDTGWWKGEDGIWYPPAGVEVEDRRRPPRRH